MRRNIAVQNGSPALVLAPMEGVTDAPLRELLSCLQPWSFCVSEFIRVAHDVPPAHVLLQSVPELKRGSVTTCGTLVIPQILGGDAELMAQTAARLCELGAPGIDINFGCPAPTVNRHDGGATLLKYPERIRLIVSSVRAAVPDHLSVSAKLRLGWDTIDSIDLNAAMAAEGGADWITIHGRTKVHGYTPPAYWKPIGRVREALKIPVIANGEIWSTEDLKRCQDESRCEHFMIGRGALACPELSGHAASYLSLPQRSLVKCSSWFELMSSMQATLASFGSTERRILARMKQWLRMASNHGKFQAFDTIKRLESTSELLNVLRLDVCYDG